MGHWATDLRCAGFSSIFRLVIISYHSTRLLLTHDYMYDGQYNRIYSLFPILGSGRLTYVQLYFCTVRFDFALYCVIEIKVQGLCNTDVHLNFKNISLDLH